ncbi:MAG TPA: hypothetical protein VGL73_00225 [Caulobacteraceae bacterium]
MAKARDAAIIAAALTLAGCQHVGPSSIAMGRPDYNAAIQQTSQQQLLENIVRVRDAQMPLVMDVTQINAGLTFQASAGAQVAGIGGQVALQGAGRAVPTSNTAGALASLVVPAEAGLFTSGVIYQETPTITYTPLTGQPLIAQLSTPITVDFLATLPDSDWPITAVMTFAVNYAAPNYLDTSTAINALSALDAIGAVTSSAGRSTLSGGARSSQGGDEAKPSVSTPGASGGGDDTLTFYLLPGKNDDLATREHVLRLWISLLRIYWPVESQDDLASYLAHMKTLALVTKALDAADQRGDGHVVIGAASTELGPFLDGEFRQLPSWVELRTSPVPPGSASHCNAPLDAVAPLPGQLTCETLSPVMRTRSALGVLKAAAQRPEPLIEFVSPAAYRKIRAEPWNGGDFWGTSPNFYTLLPADEDSVDCAGGHCDHPSDDAVLTGFFDCYVQHASLVDLFSMGPSRKCPAAGSNFSGAAEHRLATARRFLLIVESDAPPSQALPGVPIFVAWRSSNHWYAIADDDETTKRNFALLSELMTIMAIPTQTSQPTPTVSVGGRGG